MVQPICPPGGHEISASQQGYVTSHGTYPFRYQPAICKLKIRGFGPNSRVKITLTDFDIDLRDYLSIVGATTLKLTKQWRLRTIYVLPDRDGEINFSFISVGRSSRGFQLHYEGKNALTVFMILCKDTCPVHACLT